MAETSNGYERHRILLMYHLFVHLLLAEVKDGLGGAWAFALRDIIYTLIHHINRCASMQAWSHSPPPYPEPTHDPAHVCLLLSPPRSDEVSNRSVWLCCDLLTSVCRAALQFCDDALDCHLQVIVGTLMAQVTSRPPPISQQVRGNHRLSGNKH